MNTEIIVYVCDDCWQGFGTDQEGAQFHQNHYGHQVSGRKTKEREVPVACPNSVCQHCNAPIDHEQGVGIYG